MMKKNYFQLSGKRALITGSSEGIGYAIAETFALHGCEIVLHDKDSLEKCEKALEKLKKATGTSISYQTGDFNSQSEIEKLLLAVPHVDILILNASMQLRKGLLSITRNEFDQHVNTNLWATTRLIQQYAPTMIENKWGRIVTIGSVQQVKPHPEMPIYAALKAGVSNLVVNLSIELGKHGVTVNNIAPGVIRTARNQIALDNSEYAEIVRSKIPVGYFGEPNDCAGITLLLCSEEGRYITGQNIYCDGGMSIQ